MPRIKQYSEKYADSDFVKEIDHSKVECGIRTDRELAGLIGVSPSTLCCRRKTPTDITVEELRGMIQALCLDPRAVLAFLGYKEKDIQKMLKKAGGRSES